MLFDLDGTLYPYAPCHQAGLAAAHAAIGGDLGLDAAAFEREYQASRRAQFERLGEVAAAHSRELYFKDLVDRVRGRADVGLSLDGLEAYWAGFHRAMAPFPAARPLLDALAGRGLTRCLVTNLTTRVQLEKLVTLGLDDAFDHIVTSEEAGADKPDPRPFEVALARCGVEPGEAWMIGDDLARDVEGAASCGIPALWMPEDSPPSAALPPGCHRIEGLAALLEAPWAECWPAGAPGGAR